MYGDVCICGVCLCLCVCGALCIYVCICVCGVCVDDRYFSSSKRVVYLLSLACVPFLKYRGNLRRES